MRVFVAVRLRVKFAVAASLRRPRPGGKLDWPVENRLTCARSDGPSKTEAFACRQRSPRRSRLVNRVLTSPLLCYLVGDAAGDAAAHDVQNDPPGSSFARSRAGGRRALAFRAAARAPRRRRARKAGDRHGGGRAAASDSSFRRAGDRGACRGVRPLPDEQGHRAVRRGRGTMARPPLCARRARSIRQRKSWCSTARARGFFSPRSPPRAG